ncbi:hypothetical protein [Micromonospora sp. NPDC005174]|uniref:hypothetical protein n=1 Tax=Micromonospora sp. NPDC005174 TaxID=3157018 RepID=UPI0033B0F5E3
MSTDPGPLLTAALEAAVPLHILNLAQLPARVRDSIRQRWAAKGVDEIAHRGDTLQFGSKKKGEAAQVFNALARALAAAAFQPGGITFAGVHWCTDHQQCADSSANPLDVNATPGEPTGPTYQGRPINDVHLPEVA